MVRETRHLWVGNLPDNIREDRIREHFKRYGRVQSVKLLPRSAKEETGENAMACTVAFMDIKSASKAHTAEHKIDDRTLTTEYYEPAAIPSAASPQNTPSSYSTSPGSTRFPNGHGSTEEHGNFNDRFYDRPNSRVAEGEFIRRTGYHDNGRGRNRDRGYRNGPSYNNVIDRTHRTTTLNNSWTYDSTTRYNSQTNETGYSSAPSSESNERRSSDVQSSTKKKKSRSGSRSPSPSGSTSSRSPSRSRSRSSSSSSSSTTSRATSSTSSPKSRRLASSINSAHQPVVHSEDRRPLAICVRNLPLRSSDTSLKDGLFHEYKKHGKVTWVKVVGQSSDRQAIVCFKKPEDVEKALEVSYDKLFFGCKIEVAPYQGYDVVEDNDLRPYEAEIDEFHPKATRTLFIGNLEKDVTASDLRKHFDQFGEIIEIDIKKQGAVGSYAFCQFSDIISVVKAIRTMDGEHLGNNRIKLGFGKSMPTNCVWVDGIVESVNEKYLMMQFDPFGSITQVIVDREKGQALVFYEQQVNAQAAVLKMRGATLRGRKIQVDFASRECQEAFYEHLEKQGHVLERPGFEERRDSTARSFDAAALNTTNRFSRYDTPTRPRTSSYSSRSSAATSACNTNAIPSPGTPGSVTPRGGGSRSRIARFSEYYDQTAGAEYGDRHFRSYDEYSQGSAASHEDTYEHDYGYSHDSPSHLEPLESRTLQGVNSDHPVVPFAPPDIRNLQKERVHLLEQLEECPSSGDELISPKKRLKLDHLDNTSEVIIEANRDHRKVMEVRRLSDASIKHHSRRPSVDSKHSREITHERGGSYLPHAVCKRRKTAGSDSGSRVHHYDHSGSESVGGSRPGTPLCDERPEHFTPSEPRRIPREREGPLTLPLPRFAAQVMNRGSVSVAGIKGQKETILSSPPPAVTSPRITNPKPPSPAQVPPPASPPPRPPSLSSNSSDSDIAPPSPSLDERIKSLEEKYEKWSGSRALSAAGGDALAKLDATRERFRFRHKLLDLDLKEVQPSEIVKSVMAKRSVFDEDSKRLENVGEKYEPREFNFFPRTSLTVQTSAPTTPLSAPPLLKTSCATQLLSPRSAGANMIPAKGLQYPFPSHPPVQPPPPSTPTTTTASLLTTASASTTNRGSSHGDNRLKPCASAPSDNRTPSKVSVNRNITSSVVVSNLTQIKTSDNNSKNGVNIPANPSESASATQTNPSAADTNVKHCKGVRDAKTGDRVSEKVSGRRDSVNTNGSPKSETKSRRNSDSFSRKGDESDRQSENSDSSLGEYKKDRARSEERRKERLENERLEKERLEQEKQEKERLEKEIEKQKVEKEREEKERIEKERLERERFERERKREKEERDRKEREERERREREERERREREEQQQQQQLERERLEKEKREREKKEREEREKREREEREREEKERERREREERERERREKEEKERERREREELETKDREDRERQEREEKERSERERLEKERKRDKDEERKHKDDNQEKRRDDHSRHRENHSENKHKDNSVVDSTRNAKENRDEKIKDIHEISRKDSSRSSHESNRDSKSKHHFDRDTEKRKDSMKENNLFEKSKNVANDIQEVNKNRQFIESRHLSIDVEKNRQYDTNITNKMDPSRRKERNNSLPSNIGMKRRISSHENIDNIDEAKRIKLSQEHRKLSERRDSKDSRSDEKSKSKHKNSTSKSHDEKVHVDKGVSEDKRKDRERDKEERHKNKLHKLEKQKLKNKSRDKESPSTPKSPGAKELSDKDFLARLDLHATVDIEKQKQQRKEMKEKRKQESMDVDDRKDNNIKEESRRSEDRKKDKSSSSEKSEKKVRAEETSSKSSDERKIQKKERIRKSTHNSSDNTDSDEPKKHSIFDIVDDEPAYISMYDKVKARSCKNMQKQEEEKRQEKIKAKFSQLKQSRAKREEKKRSTSWDEDSDSDRERHDKSDGKSRRGNKMMIASSDEDELGSRKPRKKHDIYDSDSDRVRQIKSEQTETSDDDRIRNKSLHRKGSKSRITSDTSDDEFKKLQNKIKSEIFSDNDVDHSSYCEKKNYRKVKDEYDEKFIKKERKNSKHMDSLEQINAQIFGDSNSPILDMKMEKYNNRHSFGENSSADENAEAKKEKSELRKKHKKKQKRQKNSVSSEESCKLESVVDLLQSDDKTKHEKKKQHSKKDKRKDKTKDEDKLRDKSKKSKKNKSDNKSDAKRDGKMENIFGSLSEDSDALKEPDPVEHVHKQNSFLDCFSDENIQMTTSMYASDSDSVSHEKEVYKEESKEIFKEEKETFKLDEKARVGFKEEHRKRKEKRRREKERRMREEMNNENSMDFADMGKQLEANIKDDSTEETSEDTKVKVEVNDAITESTEDSFKFLEEGESQDFKKEERREIKEKKKKRKKSKEEKQSRHHHHHHHDKNKLKSPEFKKETAQLEEVKVEIEVDEKLNQSLPNLLDLPSPPPTKSSPNLDYSASPREPLISPIPKTPSSKDKKRDKFIPGFGSEIDEKIHESAIKSISEFDTVKSEAVKPIEEEVLKPEKVVENIEEKPRVVISQEETEDAVAALLGESFGGDHFEDSYNEEVMNQNSEQSSALPEETIQQDDEEMRQAVQSLNSSGDLEIKPDTPQSEHELQIDTDTDEPEELSSAIKLDPPTRAPDMVDLSQPPKTPDIATFYRNDETPKSAPTSATTALLIKTTPNIGSPPSLTPLKPQNAAILEAKKNLEKTIEQPTKSNSLSVPILPEQTRTVISQSWSLPEKKETVVVPKLEPPVIKVEDKIIPTSIQTSVVAIVSQAHTKINVSSPRTYSSAPVVKISESTFPPLTIIAKQEPTSSPKTTDLSSPKLVNLQSTVKASSPSLMHNLPARPPYQVSLQQQKQITSQESITSVSSRVSAPNFSLNRLPITPIMVSKPLQPTTVVLPQPKIAHNIEPPKLVPTSDLRQERPRMVCQTATIAGFVQTQPRMVVQTNLSSLQRGLPPQGLLVPAKQLPPNSYSYLTQTSYNLQTVVKETPSGSEKCIKTPPAPSVVVSETTKVLPTSVPVTYSQSVSLPASTDVHVTQAQTHKIIISSQQPQTTAVNTLKPFMPVIQETPKLINLSSSNVDLQKCVISTKTTASPPTSVVQQQQQQNKDQIEPVVKSETIEQDSLKVVKPVTRTSTPSPVIVSAHKDNAPVTKIKPEIKAETPVVKNEEEAKPLAIEKVTEELNLTLKKESEETDDKPSDGKQLEIQSETDAKVKADNTKESTDLTTKLEAENISVIKEIDKFDEEKADTESIVSDISKERSSAEILTKDDALDSKEDSDYWSAKEVNIDSVIKKVDALCSGDELSDHSSEMGKDEWYDHESNKTETDIKNESKEDVSEKGEEEPSPNSSKLDTSEGDLNVSEEKEVSPRGCRRGGRTRGRKTRGVDRSGVQTRRGKVTTPAKRGGGRGGRPKNERKITKSESETCADVYEFRDDSDENNINKDRPRLILTIKSPAIISNAGSVAGQTTIVKEVIKETVPQPVKPTETKDEFASPVTNTRKSRRLQEKDIFRNTVDDTIEDVVRNTAVVTRSTTAAAQNQQTGGPRRSARQTATKVQQDSPRKSPRGGRSKKDRRASETTDDSSEEKSLKNEPIVKPEDNVKEIEKPKIEEEKVEQPKEKPHEGLKAAVLRRVKGEMNQEPMTLIDPVTGLLTPMRECEEGRYIPVPGAPNINNEMRINAQPHIRVKSNEPQQQQQSVITTSQQSATPKQQKPQSLKAHVLSSQAAKAVVSQQPIKSLSTCQSPQQPLYISKPNVPINQNLNVNVSLANYNIPAHLSPRTTVPLNITKPLHSVSVATIKSQQPPPLSPNQMIALTNQQKQQILQQVNKAQPTNIVPKVHMVSSQAQIINTQLAHINKQHQQQPQVMKQVVINKTQIQMKNPLHAQQILTGAVASPPLKQPNAARMVQGLPSSKGAMEPPKVENSSLASCVLVPRPNVSPQGQPRHVLQAGMPVPAFEATLHGERSVYNRSRSPPPAHQNSPSPQGEAMAHFPPGSVPLRPPHDLPPAHYMHHPQHVMYHQYLRQSYHLQPRSITGGLEKSGDGQEGEEAPVTSPPLELRRPGSVGLALTGRSGTVPHSLQSPHDRATDSPQVGQVYNMHSARMQHYHPGRYYEPTGEPPPAHRQLPSHGSLAALGSDRPLGHIVPLGTPDRPLSSHMTPERPLSSHSALTGHMGGLGTPDRPISTHLPPDRPLSSHGLALSAGLGAAGNLMGAVARHIGADAPASQRGLQAATPPHASQVPPQAESLLMLLKQYPCMWQGLLALKNDQAAVQMYFVSGNEAVAKCSLPKNTDGSTPPLRIFQRMRLEPPQVEGVARKMQMENEHCMLLALPCGHDHMDVLKQSTNLTNGFITYLQQKQAAGIVNVAAPGTTQPPAYVVHIFPSCDFVNENLRRIAPSLLERVADIAHLLIVITTV